MDVTTDLDDVMRTIYTKQNIALIPRRLCKEFELHKLSGLRRCFNVQNLFDSFPNKVIVSMTRECHIKTLQTIPQHREGETQHTNDHVTSKGNSSYPNNFLSSTEMITKLDATLCIAQKKSKSKPLQQKPLGAIILLARASL